LQEQSVRRIEILLVLCGQLYAGRNCADNSVMVLSRISRWLLRSGNAFRLACR
jgi:hypothetical protein